MTHDFAALFDSLTVYIYFFYGLSFFAMGLVLMIELRRASRLSLIRSIRLLGAFGVLHGSNEFIEMFEIIRGGVHSPAVDAVRISLLTASFICLLAFGFQIFPYHDQMKGFTLRITILVIVAYFMQVCLAYVTYHPTPQEWLNAADTLARYSLGIPGSFLAGIALIRQRRVFAEMDMPSFGRDLRLAGYSLLAYGIVGQAFPQPSIVFPSMYVNADLFATWFGYPVQLFRSAMAIVTAFAIILALRAFEEEERRRMKTATETEMELQMAVRELSLLYETSSLLTASYDLHTLMREAVERIVRIIDPIRAGVLMVVGTQPGEVLDLASYGYTETDLEAAQRRWLSDCGSNDACWLWYDENDQEVSDRITAEPPGILDTKRLLIRRVVLPLETNQRITGKLLLETAPGGPYLSSLEAPTIIALGRQLAIAIENARLVLQIRQREARRGELLQRTTAAQEAERKRIARELHDETGQALTALALGLRGMSKLMNRHPDKAAQQIDQLQSISTQALEELRHLISDLRPSHLDDLGLVAALRWYAEQVDQRSTTHIDFETRGEAFRLPPETETTLFRIAQESLGNVIKHANARNAHCLLSFEPGSVQLVIRDDGSGFESSEVFKPGAGRAWGLIGIQERAGLTGGELQIDSSPGQGTTISVRIATAQVFEPSQTM